MTQTRTAPLRPRTRGRGPLWLVSGLAAVLVLFAVDAFAPSVFGEALPTRARDGITLAPDAAANPYDRYRLPLPERVETRIVEIATGEEVVGFGGFALSWCQVPAG